MKHAKKIGMSFLTFSLLWNPLEIKASAIINPFIEGMIVKGGRRVTTFIQKSAFFHQQKRYFSQIKSPGSGIKRPSKQFYGFATYDALFKHVLGHKHITPSFLKTFAPDLNIISAERIDDHMNSTQEFQNLRAFLNKKETSQTVLDLAATPNVHVAFDNEREKETDRHEKGTIFLHKILGHFKDIQGSFPLPKYKGTMDFVCRLDNQDLAIVEMQVIPQDYWDYRGLAYAAYVFSNQLKKGDHWRNIKRVIAINILGDKEGNKAHWKTPEFIRHYKFQDQFEASRFIDGIELIQYSIANAPKKSDNQAQKDWVTYFKKGHFMTKEEVEKSIQTPEVLEAFALSEIDKLPSEVRENYEQEDREYDRYSEHTEEIAKEREEKGREEGLQEGEIKKTQEIALGMRNDGLPLATIAKYTGLSKEEIKGLKGD